MEVYRQGTTVRDNDFTDVVSYDKDSLIVKYIPSEWLHGF